MRERVAFLRGELAIHSAPGEGTHIEVRVPMVPPKAAADVSAETEQLA
jgi:signal transduction histidine kinase